MSGLRSKELAHSFKLMTKGNNRFVLNIVRTWLGKERLKINAHARCGFSSNDATGTVQLGAVPVKEASPYGVP